VSQVEFDALLDAEKALVEAREKLREQLVADPASPAMRDAFEAVRTATARHTAAALDARPPDCSWRPPNAPHVLGTWTPRRFANGLPIAQEVHCACETCQATWTVLCSSGLPRQRIQQFALIHLHRDPLVVPRHAP